MHKRWIIPELSFSSRYHDSVEVGVNNALTSSDCNYIYHFPQFQPTHAYNCHWIHNNIFKNIKLLCVLHLTHPSSMQQMQILFSHCYAISVNVLPDDGPVRSETCKSLMFENIIVNNLIIVCIYWLKLWKFSYNPLNEQYKIHLSHLLFKLSIQILMNTL